MLVKVATTASAIRLSRILLNARLVTTSATMPLDAWIVSMATAKGKLGYFRGSKV